MHNGQIMMQPVHRNAYGHFGQGGNRGDDFVERCAAVDPAWRFAHPTDPRVFEQRHQHLVDALRAVDGKAEVATLLAVQLPGQAFFDQLQIAGNHAQRLAHIMGHGVAELLQLRIGAFELFFRFFSMGDVAGKAGGAMAHAVEALWPAQAPLTGLVVTRYGHTPPRPDGVMPRIEVLEAAHPVPDAAGLAAAEKILALAQGLSADDLVLCLISGGGSALLTLPALGLSLADKQAITQALLKSGASIGEMNCVRKHLSRI